MSTRKKNTKRSHAKQEHPLVHVQRVSSKAERDARLSKYFADCKRRAEARA